MSYIADQLAKQEQEEALHEMMLWAAARVIRDGLKREDPGVIELMNELKEVKK